MVQKTFCDRCGREIAPNQSDRMEMKCMSHPYGSSERDKYHDLCPRCAASFETWLEHPLMVNPSDNNVPILKDGTFTDVMYVMTQREGSNYRRASWPTGILLGVHGGFNVKLDIRKNTSEKLTIEDFEAEDWMEIRAELKGYE